MRVLRMGSQRFVPKVDPGTQILGVVQRGQEIGALARTRDGRYMQVNGDVQQFLDTSQVELALRLAGISQAEAGSDEPAGPRVTIKRRRALQLP